MYSALPRRNFHSILTQEYEKLYQVSDGKSKKEVIEMINYLNIEEVTKYE